MLINKDDLARLLIGWPLYHQTNSYQVWKLLLTDKDFNMEIS